MGGSRCIMAKCSILLSYVNLIFYLLPISRFLNTLVIFFHTLADISDISFFYFFQAYNIKYFAIIQLHCKPAQFDFPRI